MCPACCVCGTLVGTARYWIPCPAGSHSAAQVFHHQCVEVGATMWTLLGWPLSVAGRKLESFHQFPLAAGMLPQRVAPCFHMLERMSSHSVAPPFCTTGSHQLSEAKPTFINNNCHIITKPPHPNPLLPRVCCCCRRRCHHHSLRFCHHCRRHRFQRWVCYCCAIAVVVTCISSSSAAELAPSAGILCVHHVLQDNTKWSPICRTAAGPC